MRGARWFGGVVASIVLLGAAQSHAHFKLLKPASWLNEDHLGGPQKGSPCGPGNKMLFLGDDVQPVPFSNAVSTFRAGETITLQLDETIYHPGYFRVSLAKVPAKDATTKDFPDPPLTDLQNCHFDWSAVKTVPHDNVLADGLFMATKPEGEDTPNRSLTQTVKLPDEPCENCSLQIVQVMEGHPAASCFYFHCADIKIVADPSAVPPASADDDDAGCSVHAPGTPRAGAWSWLPLAAVLARCVRRRKLA
jgi:hypothetical protein